MGRLVPAFVGLLAAGCVSASVHRLDQDIRPPRPPDVIEVLEETPEKPYTVIAHIECETDAVFHDVDDLRRKLIEEAAELGGDALILGPESRSSQPIILTTGMIMSEQKGLEADVIVFDRSDGIGDDSPSANAL
jgi:hypothetical protein